MPCKRPLQHTQKNGLFKRPLGHFIAIVWHQKLIFCTRHWESFQSCLWRLKQIFLAPCCHKFKLKMERRVNSQNIKRKASTYPWFAETYSSNIYCDNWVAADRHTPQTPTKKKSLVLLWCVGHAFLRIRKVKLELLGNIFNTCQGFFCGFLLKISGWM